MSRTESLRTGRTTGTCAAAAAMAGVRFLLTGELPESVDVPLPPGGFLAVPIERIEAENEKVRVTVIKDGGDDPDATHGCEIQAMVGIEPGGAPLTVTVDGGTGVGRATLPGLPVDVGEAAINPEPKQQIETAVLSEADGMESGHISVLVEVPDGETVAAKTMNARLGVLGGISILGTQGIVKPYSHDSWKATIEEGLDVARAQGLDHAVFTTGRRSERFYLERYPDTPPLALIQAADFFEFSMQAAARRGFARVTWSVFFGKLAKQAQGAPYTHAQSCAVDFDRLANRCAEVGMDGIQLPEVRQANTAVLVLGMLEDPLIRSALISRLADDAKKNAQAFSGGAVPVDYVVFDFSGKRLT